jgi:hypothetical protein
MNQHRVAARWFAGLVTAGVILAGGIAAPAQADTGWNGTKTTVKPHTGHYTPTDTGWNGT